MAVSSFQYKLCSVFLQALVKHLGRLTDTQGGFAGEHAMPDCLDSQPEVTACFHVRIEPLNVI